MSQWMMPLFGGVCIGVAASFMLFLNGRVTGVSGILNGVLVPRKGDTLWRFLFIVGLMVGGLFIQLLQPESFLNLTTTSPLGLIVAGLFVGFGTVMSGGCTSGHGICGISRLSVRSIVATGVFMAAGFLSVYIFKHLLMGYL
ncbi:YeeE/YedE family protein [bacterium]|nr:YeeE/YedE family protein [bacterium]